MSSNAVIDRASCLILSSWMVFHQYVFFHVSSNCVNGWTSFHTLSGLMVFHQFKLFHVSSNAVIDWTSFHTLSSWMVFHQYELFHVPSNAVIARFMMSWKYSAARARMWLKKVGNVTNNAVIKCVIRARSICTSKNSVFPDFLIRLNRKSGFFFTKTCPHTSGLI